MNVVTACPVCGAAETTAVVVQEDQTYKGFTCKVDLHMRQCAVCSSEFAGIAEGRQNKRSMVDFKKRADGLLSGARVREIRKKLDLTIAEADTVFGGGPVAFSKYENDDLCQSAQMDKLLRGAEAVPAFFDFLCLDAGLKVVSTQAMSTSGSVDSEVQYVEFDKSAYYEPKIYRSDIDGVMHAK